MKGLSAAPLGLVWYAQNAHPERFGPLCGSFGRLGGLVGPIGRTYPIILAILTRLWAPAFMASCHSTFSVPRKTVCLIRPGPLM
jgi:hypothetical protein